MDKHASKRSLPFRSSRHARLLALGAAIFAQHAAAVDYSVGAAAGPAQGRTDCLASQPCDRSGAFGKLEVAAQFQGGPQIAASYFHAGTFKGRDEQSETVYGGDFRADAIGLTAGYDWPFAPAWHLVGRGGFAVVRTHFRYDDPFSGTAGKTTLQPLLGVGIRYALTPALALGLDYDETRIKVHASHGPLRMPGVSIQYKF